MKQEEQIGIIIPVYNTEVYLERCLESLLNQSYKNIEIIIVDDCSTDNSFNIIKKYLLNPKIKYIKNKQNVGVSKSRNIGLQNVNSDYILFLDSDDWLDLNCLDKAMEKFHSNNTIDIVIWEIKTALHDMKICERYKYSYDNILSNTMALSLLSHTYENEYFLSPLLGCKLFKYSLINSNHLNFFDSLYEDDMFSFLAFYYAKNVGLITNCSLYYYQNNYSLTHILSSKHIDDLFITFKRMYNHIINSHLSINIAFYYKYLEKCITSLLIRINSCVHDIYEISQYKKLLFEDLYKYINMDEYFKYNCNINI